ncbi:MAG: CpsD/CapB family tyrosine-protein kinase [Ktedonobacteraceae bacterium]|nr:CpsD/CapB family tyrosine-protein kinase [Ktedonobacteraceae bacterium]
MNTLAGEQITLLTDLEMASAYVTAYHTLYTNIAFDWDGAKDRQHTIVFTTPTPYPGQATVAANVAIAAAQNGTSTILVDADLRECSLQRRFGSETEAGLSELLTSSKTITPQLLLPYLWETAVPGLRLLGSGHKQPQFHEISRLFATRFPAILDGARQILEEASSPTGCIIIHSPPVLSGTDASLISARAGQTFLIIASGHTTSTQARRAQEQLERAHAKLAGTILLHT